MGHRRMNKRIDELKENFISILNHDLKTPILAQLRSLNLLLEGAFGALNSEQAEMIRLNKESCETILDMVSTTLTNYKFEKREIVFDYKPVNIQQIVEECCAELDNKFKEKKLKVLIYPSSNGVIVHGDAKYLKQAVFNIIANSITYAYTHSVFCIRIKNTGLNSCISVINKGHQLSDDMLGCMFDYYACNSSKNTKIGFGIKLYLALQIVKAHFGGIVVRNNKNDEIVFDIILPLYSPNSSVIRIDKEIIISENMPA